MMNCTTGTLSSTYLGLPLGAFNKYQVWNPEGRKEASGLSKEVFIQREKGTLN